MNKLFKNYTISYTTRNYSGQMVKQFKISTFSGNDTLSSGGEGAGGGGGVGGGVGGERGVCVWGWGITGRFVFVPF